MSERPRDPMEPSYDRASRGGRRRRSDARSQASRDRVRASSAGNRRSGALEAPPRTRIERERRRRRVRKVLLVSAVTIGVLLFATVAGGMIWLRSLESQMQQSVSDEVTGDVTPQKVTEKLGLTKPKPAKPFTILLMGADRRHGDTAWRADTIILAKVDPQTKRVWMLSIPRDTRVEIPGYGPRKINTAHTLGGRRLTVETVQKLTGVKINHYMEVDFRRFSRIVDAIGGVWVNVPVTIDDWNAASGSPHHRAKHIDAGYQKLDGEHALTFVRSREFPDGDFSRMKNQQIFFKALAKQAGDVSLLRMPALVSQVAKLVSTDMSLKQMLSTAQALRDAGSDRIYTTSVKGEWRTPYVWIDEKQLASAVSKMKAGESFDSTKTVAAAAAAVTPSKVTVTVRNGAGIAGVASQASKVLVGKGFKVPTTGNANQFVYKETLVVYNPEHASAAKLVSTSLPVGRLVESRGMYSFTTDVLVVVGKDWATAKQDTAPVPIKQQ